MCRLSSGDVICISGEDVLWKGGIGSHLLKYDGKKLAIVVCVVPGTVLGDYIYVLVDGQLLELWFGLRVWVEPQALVKV